MTPTNGRTTRHFQPMTTAGTHHFIERTYRESGTFQWVRECLVNSVEAGATRVEFGIEWQAVENKSVYRRVIADNGQGMSPAELVEFFNTFGGGGKPIGGAHENFGVGSKTSLLPWNYHGLVVISWQNGEPSMIWVERNTETAEYGLRIFETTSEDGDPVLDPVVVPFVDDEHGCDWSRVKPDFINQHGTVVVLLGNDARTNTVMGDPSKNEGDIKGISSYLNRRFWEFRDGVQVTVDELRTEHEKDWPAGIEMATRLPAPRQPDRRTNRRAILGARHFIEYPKPAFKIGALKERGAVTLTDKTTVIWYLWDGERPNVHSYAAKSGFIGVLYQGELYDVTAHHSTYRSFGISEGRVRQNLWLIAIPNEYEDGKRGVYPRTDRNALLMRGGPDAGGPPPLNDWAGEFAERMPAEIVDAHAAARGNIEGSIDDESWRARLKERFGKR